VKGVRARGGEKRHFHGAAKHEGFSTGDRIKKKKENAELEHKGWAGLKGLTIGPPEGSLPLCREPNRAGENRSLYKDTETKLAYRHNSNKVKKKRGRKKKALKKKLRCGWSPCGQKKGKVISTVRFGKKKRSSVGKVTKGWAFTKYLGRHGATTSTQKTE